MSGKYFPLLSAVIVVVLSASVPAAPQPDRLPLWWPSGLRQAEPIGPESPAPANTPAVPSARQSRISNPRELRYIAVAADTDVLNLSSSRTLSATQRHTVITAATIVAQPAGQRSALIVVAGDDHRVRLLEAEQLRIVQTLEGHTDWVRAIAVRPDGKALATAGNDRTVRLWDLSDGRLLYTFDRLPQAVAALAYSPDGHMLAAAGLESKIRLLIDDGGGRLTRELDATGGDFRAVCFSPDGRHVAAAGRTGGIYIWEAPTGRQVMHIALPRGTVYALTYSPDGSLIASGGSSGQVQLWRTADGQSAGTLGKDLGIVMSLEFVGPQYLAAGTSNNLIHLWNIEDRNEHHRLRGHTGSVAALRYDPAGNKLVSAGYDCTVRLWELGQP